jgi:filamentous hemagglutinin family protein
MAGSVGTAGTGTMARRRDGGLLLGLALGVMLLGPAPGRAEVATDGTLGAKVRLTGRDVKIPARLGQVRGKNLFHSFQRFGIDTGGKVTFTGPDGLKNVIGRVTGGEPSRINGTLASRVSGADLWLLNPAGILFGPDARLDVPGSFHASTADELRFADGAVFSALDPQGSVLSVAEPQAFGFLRAKPAGIMVDQSVLKVNEGKALSLIGGDVAIRGNNDGIANDTGLADEPGTVRARAGRITLAALDGPGAETVGTGEATGAVSGEIQLTGEAAVISSGNGDGTIRIRGGRIVVSDRTRVFADGTGSTDVTAGLVVAAKTLEVSDESQLTADTTGPGRAGTVRIQADALELRSGGQITSSAFASGNAGEVTIQAGRIALRDDGRISSDSYASGDAGSVVVTAEHHLLVAGDAFGSAPGIFSNALADTADAGGAGTIMVKANNALVELRDGGWIGTNTIGPGNGGETSVEAGTIELHNGGYVTSDTFGSGKAGTVTVKTDALAIRDDGRISSKAEGSGDAGMVRVAADTIELPHQGTISSTTERRGAAGEVSVTAARIMTIADGSMVTTSSSGNGRAGSVSVRASRLTVEDGGEISSSGLDTGPAGNVRIAADTLKVEDASIRTEARGAVGGRIEANAGDLIYLHGAEMISVGTEPAPGTSTISLRAPLIAFNDSRVASLTGTGQLLEGIGAVQLFGSTTVMSSDSLVQGVTLESQIGSQLTVPESMFLDVGHLLRESCAARRTGKASSFTATGRGGLPPDPAGPLAGSYREPKAARTTAVGAGSSEDQLQVGSTGWAVGCSPAAGSPGKPPPARALAFGSNRHD